VWDISAEEEACLSPDELTALRHHQVEVARLILAAAERRRELALQRFRAAKQASKKDRS
jgi:hypothetical protein